MYEIRNQASSTFSNVLTVGLLAMQIAYATPPRNPDNHNNKPLLQNSYSFGGNKATFNSNNKSITGEYDFAPNGFEQSVGHFYARLLASQEPLGAEFERVLYDNLWDLYES